MKVPSTKKILILGASGQLGCDLQSQLSSHKSRITFVRKSKWGKEFTNSKNRHFVSIDLSKISQIKLNSLVSDADIIFHLAANTNVQVKSNNERNFLIDQIDLLNKILVLLINKKTKLIFSSSCSVYGLKHNKTINDKSISDPHTSYDLLKTCSDQIIDYYKKIYDVDCCSLRFSNIYGPDTLLHNSKNRRILNKFIEQMKKNQRVAVVENGKFYRNYLHVTDAVRMLICLSKQKQFNQSIYIGCSTQNILFIDAVKLLAQKYEHKFKKSVVIDRNFPSTFVTDARSFKLAPSKIFLQGFKYKHNIETGFANLI